TVPLTNPLATGTVSGISATLTSSTAGVSVVRGTATYPSAGPGASVSNTPAFLLDVAPAFTPGTPIELAVQLTTSLGPTTLLTTLDTGTPVATTIFSQNFDSVSPGTLPAGWTAS